MKTIKQFIAIFIFLAFTFVWHACSKKDYTKETDFFQEDDMSLFKTMNGDLARVDFLAKTIDRFKILDDQKHFAPSLMRQYGNMKWHLSLVVKNKDSLFTIITPFINENDSVTALMFAYHQNDHKTIYKIYNRQNYKMYFSEQGDKDAKTINKSTVEGLFFMFGKANKQVKQASTNKTEARNIYVVETCWRYTWIGQGGDHPIVGASNWQCSYTIYDSGGSGSSGTGSDPEDHADNCNCGGTTIIYEEIKTPNQNIIDSLQGYPCAQGLLGQMPDLNEFTNSILNKIFGVSANVNVIFKPDNNGVLGNGNGGTPPAYSNDGKLFVDVLLNPSMLEMASQEFILAVMIHESVHAYYKYQLAKYEIGLVDSFYIKTNYPSIWQYRNERGGGSGEHREMSDKMIENISEALEKFNESLSPSISRALALNGLHQTPYWKTLSDTTTIKSIWDVARYGNETQASSLSLHKCND